MKSFLIQILIPVYDNKGKIFPETYHSAVSKELLQKFKGLTAFVRSPATGLWKPKFKKTIRDDLILYEVIASKIERKWWKNYSQILKDRFSQNEILIRTSQLRHYSSLFLILPFSSDYSLMIDERIHSAAFISRSKTSG
jgi:hypothetical protein